MPAYTVNLGAWSSVSSGYGVKAWATPANAEYVDSAYATCGATTSSASNLLQGTNPTSISPGVGEYLSSIGVTITRYATSQNGNVTDQYLYLVSGGSALTAVNNAATSTIWPSTAGTASYTFTAAQLAALGLTLASVQNSGFGIGLAVLFNSFMIGTAYVDAIVLTINTLVATPETGFEIIPANCGITFL